MDCAANDLGDRNDFRFAAFDQSRSVLQSVAQEGGAAAPDIFEVGQSVCVPTSEDVVGTRRRLRRAVFAYAGSGILGFLIAGAIALWLKRLPDEERAVRWIAAAGASMLLGFVLLTLGTLQERAVLRRMVSRRLGCAIRGAVYVHIEDPASFDTLKVLAEDAGILILHPDVRCLQIEGISARYLVYGDDVESLESRAAGKSRAVLLTYRVGPYPLTIAIKDQTLLGELQAQLLHRSSLLHKIRRALNPGKM